MQIIVNIVISASIYCILSISFEIIYNTSKFFNLTHAIIITVGAYFTFWLSKQLMIPLFFSIPISIILSTLLGVLTELWIFKQLRKRNTQPLLLLIASLGLYIILQNIISLIWGNDTKSIRVGEIKIGNEIFGAYLTNTQIIIVLISLSLFILITLFLKFHKAGQQIRAVSSNKELSNIFGIDSNKVIVWSFAIGSVLAAITGILVGFDTDIFPTMGFNLLLYGVVAMIIGGINSTWGLIGGSLLIATAQHLGAYYIDSKWMDAIAYIILILFLIWKPLGFSGKRLKKVEI